MKKYLFVFFLAVFLTIIVVCVDEVPTNISDLFKSFISRHKKQYVLGSVEYKRRLKIFEANVVHVNKLNGMRYNNMSAWFGVTKFSDLTPEEFKDTYLTLKPSNKPAEYGPLLFEPQNRGKNIREKNINIPNKFDWRDKKVITPIKNQDACGACWAFSTIETIETMYALKTGKLREFSVQEIIDCAGDGNFGCRGGDTCRVLSWMKSENISIYDELKYPLENKNGECRILKPDPSAIKLRDFTCNSYNSEEEYMLYLLATVGPLVVTVDASTWNHYMGGVIMYHCESYHNHAVQIIGYDTTGHVPYYIVRNSWGSDFGDHGYLYIRAGQNLCGLADRVSTAFV